MVSLLQDQANIAFSENHPHRDQMQSHEDVGSPIQQEGPNFCHQSHDGDNGVERSQSESSSPSSSPPENNLYGVFPSGAHRYGYEDPPRAGFLRTPFQAFKRQFAEEGDPLGAAEGVPPFKAASMEQAYEGPEAEMYLAGPQQGWGKGLPYGLPGQGLPPTSMDSDIKLKPPSLDDPPGLYCYQPQMPPMYCPSHPFHQYPTGSGSYPVTYISSSHYPYQRIAPQGPPEHHQPLFPKPIYSYSILIFMALRNSKTGSLPVSEIYNFMTEHFPYFKTAPDGWKNSVRHNLSLNKCFEKVENKSGSSSRKGCLWALNPAKIEKMQEELQKWKRKDPIAVRKSMAKPEELDTLIGGKSEKPRPPLMAGGNPSGVGSRQVPLLHPSQHGPQRQDSPVPAQSPKVLAGPRSVQDVLVPDGDLSSDIDALNPSLTDFDLQGNLWEELKDDSLTTDPLALVSASPCFPGQMDDNGASTDNNNNGGNSHCNGQHHGLPEIQLTTLYSAFMELDTGSAPFLNSLGAKPIALV
ncbi:forkhead box protein N1 [Anolis sagrei]|uniref:forkhead box protein N1 n=1 Tax=Anolis sagrei TaxID=38937 RepID=UPI0035205824